MNAILERRNRRLQIYNLAELEEIENAVPPRRETRVLMDRSNPIVFYNNLEFKRIFRLNKETVLNLTHHVEADLQHISNKGSPLNPLQQICLCLSFFACGSFQHVVGHLLGVKKSCACNTIWHVSQVIARQKNFFIKMPSREKKLETSNIFFQKYGLPGIAYGVDGTHIMLGRRPNEAELPQGIYVQDFWCRKQFYSINCQIIGDDQHKILNIVARWAGSTHDARIWRNSRAKTICEQDRDFKLVGDSAYPISSTLIKPFINPNNPMERRFNRKISGIRTICTENTIGIWKQRFPFLRMGIRTKLERTLVMIVASAVLHNVCILWNDIADFEDFFIIDRPIEDDVPFLDEAGGDRAAGQIMRDQLMQEYCNI